MAEHILNRTWSVPLACGALLLALSSASAQTGAGVSPPVPTPPRTGHAVSPVEPGDLSRPVFDTTTSVFGRPAINTAATTVVAEVEGHAITLAEVGDVIRALPRNTMDTPTRDDYETVLDQLVRRHALAIRAEEKGLDEDPEAKRLVAAAVSDQLAGIYVRRELAGRITETMLLKRYDTDVANAPSAEDLRVRVIVTGDRKQIEGLIAAARNGADFAAEAKTASKDSSAKDGGDLGFRNWDQLPPEIAGVVSGMQPGQIAPTAILTSYGWMAVKLEERRPAPKPSFAAAREWLVQRIQRELEPSVTEAAMKGLTIRSYALVGRETTMDEQPSMLAPSYSTH